MYRNKLLAKLHILLKEAGAEAHKEEIYAGYGVESAKDMTDVQIEHLIARLVGSLSAEHRPAETRPRPAWRQPELTDGQMKALRSEVLLVLTANPDAQNPRRRGLGMPVDWQIINPFIRRHAGKSLPEMTTEELRSFKTKLCAMRQTGWRYKDGQMEQDAPARGSVPPVSIYIGVPSEGGGPVN